MPRSLHSLAAAGALTLAAGSAQATWSIILIDTRTGEIAVGSATCLTNFDLQAGTPVLIPGIGAATAQSFVDQGGYNRVFIRDRLLEGVEPNDILDLLEVFDGGHQTRQYGMGDAMGGVATFTGDRAGAWAGGVTGRVGDIVYAVQGNVLTGPPVVLEAEQVIITSLDSGLDLPETLMLAMDESRLFGGDGRCSCSQGDADGCGSPPSDWDPETGKSADIAYMLIARAGDGFACNSVYRAGRTPVGVALGDVDSDGRVDVTVTARNESTINVFPNADLHPAYATLGEPQPIVVTDSPTGIELVDIDNDNDLDIVYAEPSRGRVGVSYNDGTGSFGFPALISVGDGAFWVAVADFNGDSWPDAATAERDTGNVTILLNDGAGRLSVASTFPVSGAPDRIIAAEITGDGGIDLAVLDPNEQRLHVLSGDGVGGFAEWASLDTLNSPRDIAAADVDGDGRTDLASTDRIGRKVSVYRQTAPGSFVTARLGDDATYTAVTTADLNRDGLPDLVATSDGPRRLTVLLGRPGADPVADSTYATSAPSDDLSLADFNGDGFLDAAFNVRQSNGVIVVNGLDPAHGAGFFNSGEGCATADYFMEFNIAFQSRNAPDPVDQLQDLFNTWRDDLVGVADAVRSNADLAGDRLPVGATTTILVEPLDWRQTPVGAGLSLSARHADGSDALTRLDPAIDNGDGTYTVPVSAEDLPPDSRGVDTIEIVVEQAGRTVVLMPALSLTLTGPVADWNGDGVVDTRDVNAFLNDWAARDPATDLTGDGVVDSRDILEFVRVWAGN